MKTKQTAFEKRCLEASEKTGVPVEFLGDDIKQTDAFQDDGSLHVQKKGQKLWAIFDVSNGQNDSAKRQNRKTKAVMDALGLAVTDRVLTDETDAEDEHCSHCGR